MHINELRQWVGARAGAVVRAWRGRDETGGITDETAMIGFMLLLAIAVGGIITALVTGAANNLSIPFAG
jgi:hypothetical protein